MCHERRDTEGALRGGKWKSAQPQPQRASRTYANHRHAEGGDVQASIATVEVTVEALQDLCQRWPFIEIP